MITGCRVLFIGDSYVEGKLVELILVKERNDEVRCVLAEHALRDAEQNPPDLIIIEFTITDADAFEIYRQFNKKPRFRQVPVLLWYVPNPRKVYPKAQRVGIAGCIQLVCTPEELLTARDTVLRGESYYPYDY